MYKFDENQCNLLRAFLKLKEKCFLEERNSLEEFKRFPLHYSSFYSSLRDVIDLPIYFLVNEELSNTIREGGYLFISLWDQVFDEYTDEFYTKENHFNDIARLFVQQYNSILGSLMLDFIVSSFSVFDCWISKLFDELCIEQKENMIKHREEKIKKIIRNNLNDIQLSEKPNEIIKRIKKIYNLDFFSLPDKLECIYKIINENHYKRNWKQDKEVISFLAKRRNTVHNLGFNKSKSTVLNINNKEYKLEQDKPYVSENYTDDLLLIGELVDIYTALLNSIPKDIRINKINSFAEVRLLIQLK